ncbi:MAG TPA: type II toxin-antitoxin system RelB/DinJ family antitoxin [Myxococcaceae bacterium]|nr:type II toxin-antitoxin system RelB/DinJ family antitoxin [Myxococcaceae bacterium]
MVTPTPTTMIHVRVRRKVKAKATKALAEMGPSVSDVVRVVLTYVAKTSELPFPFLVPNAETAAAVEEARQGGLTSFENVSDLLADLNAED